MNAASKTNRNITIIGAGIVGMSCAVHLLRDGHQVRVIDKEDPGQGCSFGNAAILSPTYCVPLSMPGTIWDAPGWLFDPTGPLSIRWRDLASLTPWFVRFTLAGSKASSQLSSLALRTLHKSCVDDFEAFFKTMAAGHMVKRSGMVYVYESERKFHAAAADRRIIQSHGGVVEILDAGQLQDLAPGISAACRNGVFFPQCGQVTSPLGMVQTMADEFLKHGGTIIKGHVRDIEFDAHGPARLLCDGQSVDLDVLVVAAGALSAKFCKALGSPVPLVGERGYHLTFSDPGITLDMPVMSGDCKFAMTSMEDGLRAAGTTEFAHLEAPPNYRRAQILLTHLKRIFPSTNTDHYSQWMGRRPSTPDTLPVIGASPGFANTFFAFGHGHAGLMGSVITGRSIADLVAGRIPTLDLSPFRIDRF